MSVRARASLALTATTTLGESQVRELIGTVAARTKGGGTSLLTTGVQNLAAEVHIEHDEPGRVALSITSGKRLITLCRFTAAITAHNGSTSLRVGGLDAYKTSQSTVLGFIPVGPKMIPGIAPYKRFLDGLAVALRTADANAGVSIAQTGT